MPEKVALGVSFAPVADLIPTAPDDDVSRYANHLLKPLFIVYIPLFPHSAAANTISPLHVKRAEVVIGLGNPVAVALLAFAPVRTD